MNKLFRVALSNEFSLQLLPVLHSSCMYCSSGISVKKNCPCLYLVQGFML